MNGLRTIAACLTVLSVVAVCGCASRHHTLGTPSERLSELAEFMPASAPPVLPSPLTAEAAVRRALDASPEIESLSSAVRVARQEFRAAGDIRDPELRFGVADGDIDSLSSSSSSQTRPGSGPGEPDVPLSTETSSSRGREDRDVWQVGIRFFPRNPWELSARTSQGRASLYAAEAALSAAGTAVAEEVRRLYVDIQYAQQDIEQLEALVALRRGLVREMKELVRQGQGTVVDSSRASYRYLQAVSEHQRRLRDRDGLRTDLAQRLSVSPASLPELSEAPLSGPPDDVTTDVASLVGGAMERRADLIELGWRARAARAAFREERARLLPWLTHIQGSFTHRENNGESESSSFDSDLLDFSSTTQSDSSTSDDELEEWEISAAMALPIFSLFNQSDDVMRERWQEARRVEGRAVAEMQQDIARVIAEQALRKERLSAFDTETRDVVSELRETLAQSGDTGILPPDEIARMKEQLIEIERLRIDAEHDRMQGLLRLERAAGLTPLPVSTE
jgi:outer membrane protein TolC